MTELGLMGLLDILPERVTDDEIRALAYAIDPEMREIEAAINEIIMLPRVDELPERLLQHLALQMRVSLYEQLDPDLATKRALVRNAISWNRKKGTPAVLKEMISLFFPDSTVEEWFEYGGQPYHFRVVLYADGVEPEVLANIKLAIDTMKNERSSLEELRIMPKPIVFVNRSRFVLAGVRMCFSICNARAGRGVSMPLVAMGVHRIASLSPKSRMSSLEMVMPVARYRQPPMGARLEVMNTWGGRSMWDGTRKWDSIYSREAI
jgi:phage tail P2-like protein